MNRKVRTSRLLLAAVALVLAARAAAASLPLGYGGRLTDGAGKAVEGAVDLKVGFYAAASGGAALASESFPHVALQQGVFQVELALTSGEIGALFDGGGAVFVEVTDVTHGKTYPRQRFLAVPYALRVPVDGTSVVYDASGSLSVGRIDASKVTGLTADAVKLQGVPLGTGTPAAGAVLKYVGGQWQAVAGDSVSGNFGIGTTSAQTALDVGGALTQRAGTAPAVAPTGEGRIYFDATSNQFMVSQNGGAYAPLGTVTAGAITQVSAGTGLSGGGTTGNVTVGLAAVGTAGTYTRVLTDAYGRVTAGGTLTAADLPTVPAGMISGSLPVTQLAGTLAAAQIPQLSATQITSGTLAAAQLPALSEAQMTSGTLSVALGGTGATSFPSGGVVVGAGALPLSTTSATSQYQVLQQGGSGPVFGAVDLGQNAAVSGTLAVGHLPQIPATQITGSFAAAQISGTLAASALPNVPASLFVGTLAVSQGGTGSTAALGNNRLIVSSGGALVEGPTLSVVAGNLGIGTTSASSALDLNGALTQRGTAAPAVAPVGQGRLYFDSSSNQFMLSQNGGAYSPFGAGGVTAVTAGAGLTGSNTTGSVTLSLPTTGTAGVYTKVQTDAYGRVTAGGTLTTADLPPVPASLVTGSLPVTQLSGTLTTGQLPNIPTTQITGNLPATQLSGTLAPAQLPSIPTTQISGTLASAQVNWAAPGPLGATTPNTGSFTTLTASANVGIGTTSPAVSLDLRSRTDALALPAGTAAQEPASPASGWIRFNTTTFYPEFYNGSAWVPFGSAVDPAGMVSPFPTSTCPAGWLEANGNAVSRTTYSALYTAIGTTYGPGDGSTTFNLPDYRGYFLRGWSHGSGNDPNSGSRTNRGDGTSGDNVGTKQPNATAANGLSVTVNNAQGFSGTSGWGYGINNVAFGPVTATVSSSDPETRPKNVNVTYCISTSSSPVTTLASTGSGTANTVPVWTSGTALGNSPLAVYGTTVGIGTTSPGASLDIAANVGSWVGLQLTNSSTGGHNYIVESTDNGNLQGGGRFIVFDTAAGARMTIDGSGKVGIGTTSPGQMLTVAGTIESTTGGVKFPDGSIQTSAAEGPAFSVYPSANASAPASAPVKIPFDTEEFDTDNAFDTTNHRFQPARAGYYHINLQVGISMTAVNGYTLAASLTKNGSALKTAWQLINYNATFNQTLTVDTIVYLNGSTDYVEATFSTNSGTAVAQGSSTVTHLSGNFVHH